MSSYRSICTRVGLGVAQRASAPALAMVALTLAIAATAGAQPAPVVDCSKYGFGPANYDVWIPGHALAAVVGDFDNDGANDVAVTEYEDAKVYVYFGDGKGDFPASTIVPVEAMPYRIAAGDVDDDGDLDLALTFHSQGILSVLLGDGQRHFAVSPPIPSGSPLSGDSVEMVDVNNDQKLDLVVNDSGIQTHLGNGDGTFSAPVFGGGGGFFASGNLDGDSTLDLAAVTTAGDEVVIRRGNGDGTFTEIHRYGVGPASIELAVGDLNGDQKADLLIANEQSPEGLQILVGAGDGSFTDMGHIDMAGTHDVAIDDFNDDGKADMVVALYGDGRHSLAVSLGDGNGAFAAAQMLDLVLGPYSLAVGDLNGDRRPELIGVSPEGGIAYLLNTSFRATCQIACPNLFASAVNYKTSSSPPRGGRWRSLQRRPPGHRHGGSLWSQCV